MIIWYLLGMLVVVALVFALVWLVFGRGEDLPPLRQGETLTRLPRAGITGDDARRLVFQQTLRGYKTSEVDWAVEKLAREIDELRAVVHDLRSREDVTLAESHTAEVSPPPTS